MRIRVGLWILLSVLEGTSVSLVATPAGLSISTVNRFSDGSAVPGASSTLITNDSGATMTLHTSEIPAGHAVTVWWIIFNNPEECLFGTGGLRCGEGDLFGNPDVDASVVYAAGHVVGRSGRSNWGGWIGVGDTQDALFGPGLLNPLGADIHLIVHDHGVVPADQVAENIRSFGSCFPPVAADCSNADIQFAAHEQTLPVSQAAGR